MGNGMELTEIFTEQAMKLFLFWGPKAFVALIILVGFMVLSKFVTRTIASVCERTSLNILITSLLSRATKVVLLAVGVMTALGTLGINISAMVAGLGLTGFALGFALRDTISNLLAGVLLLVYRPFDISNRIKVSSHEGTVVSIDLRYTMLESETAKVLIPNSVLFTDPITIIKR